MLRYSSLSLLLVAAVSAVFAYALSNPSKELAGSIVLFSWAVYATLACYAIAHKGRKCLIACGGLVFGLSYLLLVFAFYGPNKSPLPTSVMISDFGHAVLKKPESEHRVDDDPFDSDPFDDDPFGQRSDRRSVRVNGTKLRLFAQIAECGISFICATVGVLLTNWMWYRKLK